MWQATSGKQSKADRLIELMRQALTQNLEPDEELRWFSTANQYRAPALVRTLLSWGIVFPIFGPALAVLLVKPWYVGITSKRVLFGRMKRRINPDPNGVVAVPLVDVTVGRRGQSGAELFIANPTGGLPKKSRLPKGIDVDRVQAWLKA